MLVAIALVTMRCRGSRLSVQKNDEIGRRRARRRSPQRRRASRAAWLLVGLRAVASSAAATAAHSRRRQMRPVDDLGLDRVDRLVRLDAERRATAARSPHRRRRRASIQARSVVALADRLATTSRNVTSAADDDRGRERAAERRCPARAAASSSTRDAAARSSSSASARSSSTSKRAATLASNGNWCSSRVQKAWMVCTFRPPGVSSASANSRRARARSAAHRARRWTSRGSPASSAASSSAVQSRQRVEHAVRHVGGGGLGEGDAEDFRRVDAVEQQPDHALRQHVGLARAGIGRDPGRARRDPTPRSAGAARRRGMMRLMDASRYRNMRCRDSRVHRVTLCPPGSRQAAAPRQWLALSAAVRGPLVASLSSSRGPVWASFASVGLAGSRLRVGFGGRLLPGRRSLSSRSQSRICLGSGRVQLCVAGGGSAVLP